MKCKECDSFLLSLYHREGGGGKKWVKIRFKYCKNCKTVFTEKKCDENPRYIANK